MKYLCLGYFDADAMAPLTTADIDAIMAQCMPHMERLYATGQVLMDGGLELSAVHLRREQGSVRVIDGPFAEAKEMVGGVFVVDATSMEDAVRVAKLHPTTQVADGERYGWTLEVRPIHHFRLADAGSGAITSAQEGVRDLRDAYARAAHERDAAALMRLYHPQARVFDAWATWSHDGADAWRRVVEGWLGSLGDERVRVGFDDVVVRSREDVAVMSAIVTYAGLAADGRELRSMDNRLTWVVEQDAGAWRIVHEHTSAPLAPDTATGMLRRESAHPGRSAKGAREDGA